MRAPRANATWPREWAPADNDGGPEIARTAIRGFTLAADLKGEVAEWLKALAC